MLVRRAALPIFACLLSFPADAAASNAARIPAFARKYRVSCATCHAPIPRLNAVGEAFAANGFEFAPGEIPRDTINTGDPLLRLQNNLPLAIRYDAYLTALTKANNGQVSYDQQLPWVIKLLSGGQVANKISYYVYFLLTERGSVEGLEDAYVQFTDVGGKGINIVAGQFQVSDPMFKRETRLQYEDYQPYRMRVGNSAIDLTYDRGLMALFSPREGTDVALEVVSGRGLGEATAAQQYDRDNGKSYLARLSQDLGRLRLGGFAYLGDERNGGFANGVRMFGPDATVAVGSKLELNAQLLRRIDDNPLFAAPSAKTTVDAAFAELILSPGGLLSRQYFTALANVVYGDRPLIDMRLGQGPQSSYRTFGVGAHHVLRRNVRTMVEAQWDAVAEQARFVAGATLAW